MNGCSAGGLATFLHLDYIAARMPAGMRVVGAPECGMFMDVTHADGTPGYTEVYKHVAKMQNVTGSVNAACLAATPLSERWKCFMAQYTFPHVKTPAFVINSFYDAWQWDNILAMPCNQPSNHSTHTKAGCDGNWSTTDCNTKAIAALEAFRTDMVADVVGVVAGNASPHSGFLYGCITHCGQFAKDDRWSKLSISGTSLREAFTEWLDGQFVSGTLSVDCDGPGCNPTCCND